MTEIILYSIITGFISRRLANFFDSILSYTMIFGFIRYDIAKLINSEFIKLAEETVPDDYESYNLYWKGVYQELCKSNKLFRLINCQYCISVWICFIFMFLFICYYDFTSIYDLIIFCSLSISFTDGFISLRTLYSNQKFRVL